MTKREIYELSIKREIEREKTIKFNCAETRSPALFLRATGNEYTDTERENSIWAVVGATRGVSVSRKMSAPEGNWYVGRPPLG